MERFGPFRRLELVAAGGQGEVWRAVHVGTGEQVAVKVLKTLEGRHLAAFREELRAIATLDHPRIVQILDVGGTTEPKPWFAMELAAGTLRPPRDWTSASRTALAILDALAHAHGRGLLHLDLKPANVLIGCREGLDDVDDGAPSGLRLSDFGIARRFRDGDLPGRGGSGTPGYMAPEQIRAEPARFAPETDLYALGQLVWCLCSGRPAFTGPSAEVVQAQLRGRLPPLVARFPVPTELGEWLAWCLELDPWRRPQRAADAADALRSVGVVDPGEPRPFTTAAPTSTGSTLDLVSLDQLGEVAQAPTSGPARWGPARLPSTWRRPEAWQRARPPSDSGLSLLGLRATRLVGRIAERDLLWSALREASTTGSPRAVLVRGPDGIGKTRLAEWLGERTHETGGAFVVRVRHSAHGGPHEGLDQAVTRFAGLVGLTGDALEQRLFQGLGLLTQPDPRLVRRLAGWLDGHAAFDPELLAAGLATAWNTRPVLLLVDDAGHGPDTLDFVEAVLRYGQVAPVRICAVLVVGDGADPGTESRLRRLAERPETRSTTLGPLAGADLDRLLQLWLGLSREVADRVAAESGGHPGLALRLTVELGLKAALVPGPAGLTLAEGAVVGLGARTTELDAVTAVLRGDEQALRRLEAAAVAGDDLDDVPEALVDAGFVTGPPGQRRLGSPALRSALVSRARDHGRLTEWHRRAAARPGLRREKVGLHLFEAGEFEAAAAWLLDGGQELVRRTTLREATSTAELAGRALLAAGVPPEDHRWAAQRRLLMDATALRGLANELRPIVDALLEDAPRHGWRDTEARALELRGWVRHVGGDLHGAVADLSASVARWGEVGDAVQQARARFTLALYVLSVGEVDRAEQLAERSLPPLIAAGEGRLEALARVSVANILARRGAFDASLAELSRARELASGVDDLLTIGRVDRQIANLLNQQRRYAEAEVVARRHLGEARALGTWLAVASALGQLGDALRGLRRLDEAVSAYLEAADIHQRAGTDLRVWRVNLALVHLERGDDLAALASARATGPQQPFGLIGLLLDLVTVTALAGLGRTDEARRLWPELRDRLAASHEVDADLSAVLDRWYARAPWASGPRGGAR